MLEADQHLEDQEQLQEIWFAIITAINSHIEPQPAVEYFFDLATTEEGFAEIVKIFLKNNPHLIPVLIQELEKETDKIRKFPEKKAESVANKTNPPKPPYFDIHLLNVLIQLCKEYL